MALSKMRTRLRCAVKSFYNNTLCLIIMFREEIWHILCGKIDPEDSPLRFSRMGTNKSSPEALISLQNATKKIHQSR